jgi:NitT/TauT family transport system ATP-binding protein
VSFVEIKNLWKSFDDQVVLEKLNLSFDRGTFCTIVGPSGCGKTTFLRMLLGVEQPSRGELLLDGEPFPNEPTEDGGIVFQRYSVFPHLTVLQNVMLGLEFGEAPLLGRLFGAKRNRARDQAMTMLQAVGLDSAHGRYPSELSGGMQQRLSIAQSLIKQPRILLLDEPFGALDPGIRADMHELILDLWTRNGLTVFMNTHDLKEAFTLGTRLLAFDKPRRDPQAPGAYGATVTYDLPLHQGSTALPKGLEQTLAANQDQH